MNQLEVFRSLSEQNNGKGIISLDISRTGIADSKSVESKQLEAAVGPLVGLIRSISRMEGVLGIEAGLFDNDSGQLGLSLYIHEHSSIPIDDDPFFDQIDKDLHSTADMLEPFSLAFLVSFKFDKTFEEGLMNDPYLDQEANYVKDKPVLRVKFID